MEIKILESQWRRGNATPSGTEITLTDEQVAEIVGSRVEFDEDEFNELVDTISITHQQPHGHTPAEEVKAEQEARQFVKDYVRNLTVPNKIARDAQLTVANSKILYLEKQVAELQDANERYHNLNLKLEAESETLESKQKNKFMLEVSVNNAIVEVKANGFR